MRRAGDLLLPLLAAWFGRCGLRKRHPFHPNARLVAGRKFIRSHFRLAQRRGEEPHFEHWFADRGYEIVRLPQAMVLEGAGV